MILETSSGVTGERNIEFGFLDLRKLEKWYIVSVRYGGPNTISDR